MHEQVGAMKPDTNRAKNKKLLAKRIPRMGKVVFSDNSNPVHCAVKNLTQSNAIITMTGWLGLPSNFTLFVEPDAIRADCRVIRRKGSNVEVEFTRVCEGERYRSVA